MNSRKENKLIQFLEKGKVISGSRDSLDSSGRKVTTLAFIQRDSKQIFEVELETYFSDIDTSSLNLNEEKETFSTLEAAVRFIETHAGITFDQMHAA